MQHSEIMKMGVVKFAHAMFLGYKENNCNLIIWQSKRIKRLVCSALLPVMMAIIDSVESALNLSPPTKDLHPETKHPIPIKIFADNKSLHDPLWSHQFVSDQPFKNRYQRHHCWCLQIKWWDNKSFNLSIILSRISLQSRLQFNKIRSVNFLLLLKVYHFIFTIFFHHKFR